MPIHEDAGVAPARERGIGGIHEAAPHQTRGYIGDYEERPVQAAYIEEGGAV